MGLPVSHGCFSSSRTSSILSKDHPPDKKHKSDKTSLPSNEFDPTGNFPLFLFSLFLLFCSYSLFSLYTPSHTLFPLFHPTSVCITLSDCLIHFLSLSPIFFVFLSLFLSLTHTHKQSHKTIVLMMVCSMHKACWDGEGWCVYLALCFVISLTTLHSYYLCGLI